jgi:predicted porin
LSSTWGELRLGRQDSVPFQVMAGYDFNGASNGVASWGYAGAAPWLRDRQSRSLQYFAPKSGGLSTQLGLVLKGNTAGAKDTFSGGLTYAVGALSVSGVFETKRTSTGSNFSAVAGSYDMSGIKLSAGYANGGANAKGLSLGLTTTLAGLTVGAQYARNSDTKGTAYEVFANKEVYKNTYAYVEAGHADAKTGVKGTGYAGGVIFVF